MKIAVIGAGVTGLAAAARIASQGHEVTIFEKNNNVGGRMNQLKKDGFTFDMGPTIVMMPDVYKDVFTACGKNYEDYIELRQLRYIYDVYFDHDDRITVPTDLAELQQMLESIEPGSTHGFMSFLTDVYKKYEIARRYFLERTYRKPSDFYNMTSLVQGAKLKTLNHADQLIEHYIDNEKIQKLLAFQTLYIGIDPKRGPSLYSIIPMIEMMFGVHFIKGGMYGMAQGLAQLNKDLDYSCSAFLMYIGIDIDVTDQVRLHNVIFLDDFRGNIEEIFEGRLSYDPSIYVYVPAVADKSLAPEGKTGIYVLMPTPELKTGSGIDWSDEALTQQIKEIIYRKLATIEVFEDIKSHIVSETIFTPNDFEQTYHAKFGSAFGLMPTLAQSNYYRPQNVSRDYKDLYFAGASTHPGAGVPIVLTSAKITVDEMIKDIERGV
ncbi:TPA: FAD-dependent oxidoreductase [Staphylococcus aureus]|nr:FAD-dependent oxidoreductase [Staphylococcus aureus]